MVTKGRTPQILHMTLHINDARIERLVEEIASLSGESPTHVIRHALVRRLRKLRQLDPEAEHRRIMRFLEREIWSRIPADQLGRPPSKSEREDLLGFGEGGY